MSNGSNKGVLIGAVLVALAAGAVGQHFYSKYAAGESLGGDVTDSGAPADTSTVVVRVNGQAITQGMIERRRVLVAERVGNMFDALPDAEKDRIIKENLVLEVLVDQNMKDSDIAQDPVVQEQLRESRMQVLRTAYLNKLADAAVSEQALQAAYTTQLAQMPEVEEVHARHILVKDEALAKEIIAKIKGGEAFDKLAAQYSEDKGNAAQGGDLGFFSRDEMVPEFSAAAFGMEAGAVSETPVKTGFGWHVVQVEEKRTRAKPSFDEMKAGLTAAERQRVIQETIQKWREAAQIEDTTAPVEGSTDSLETTGGPEQTPPPAASEGMPAAPDVAPVDAAPAAEAPVEAPVAEEVAPAAPEAAAPAVVEEPAAAPAPVEPAPTPVAPAPAPAAQ